MRMTWTRLLLLLLLASPLGCVDLDSPEPDPDPVVRTEQNECADGTHVCAAEATCFDTIDAYRCVCAAGFRGDGFTCTDVDECVEGSPCGAGATCNNEVGGVSCTCADGWRLEPASNDCVPDCITYTQGHGDMFASQNDEGSLELQLRSALGQDTEGLHDPADLCIVVDRTSYALMEAAGGRPAGDAFDGIGVAPGAAYWFLSQTPLDGQPWFGLSTEGLVTGTMHNGVVQWSVQLLSAPAGGELAAYFDPDGNGTTLEYLFSTFNDELAFVRNESIHEHMSWSFSAPGDYFLQVDLDGALVDDTPVSTSAVYRFVVLP